MDRDFTDTDAAAQDLAYGAVQAARFRCAECGGVALGMQARGPERFVGVDVTTMPPSQNVKLECVWRFGPSCRLPYTTFAPEKNGLRSAG